jgi:RND family efflux transporter MFP subunit
MRPERPYNMRRHDVHTAAVPRRTTDVVVSVTRPVRRDVDVKLSYTADVHPAKQVAILSKVSGFIRRLGAERGDLVREGELLVEIEAHELSAAVDQARAAMDRDNSLTNAEASKALRSAAEAQVAVARSQVGTQESQVALARATVEHERAALKIAQTNLDNTRVLAPFSGYVSTRNLDSGAAVSSQAAGTSNSSVGILVIQDIESVREGTGSISASGCGRSS